MKKPPPKVAYLKAEFPSFQKFFTYCPTAQMVEFMFPNVAYRATVYRTGIMYIPLERADVPTPILAVLAVEDRHWSWSGLLSDVGQESKLTASILELAFNGWTVSRWFDELLFSGSEGDSSDSLMSCTWSLPDLWFSIRVFKMYQTSSFLWWNENV